MILPFGFVIVSWISTAKLSALAVNPSHIRTPFYKIIGDVSYQGLAVAFSLIGFACIASFIALLFTERNRGNASWHLFVSGILYLTRLVFVSFPGRVGLFVCCFGFGI